MSACSGLRNAAGLSARIAKPTHCILWVACAHAPAWRQRAWIALDVRHVPKPSH
jgi:hypothetical protein